MSPAFPIRVIAGPFECLPQAHRTLPLLLLCRVGGGAPSSPGTGLRPPLKPDMQFSRIQLSRRRSCARLNGRNQTNKVHLVDQRVDLPLARRVDPVGKSPGALMFGSFTQGTIHLNALAHLAFLLSPTVLAERLPQPTQLPLSRLSPLRYYSAIRQLAGHRFPRRFNTYRSAYPNVTRGPRESSWGHALVFRTVPSTNTLVRWVNENGFATIVPARPCPTFGRPVRHRGGPPSTTARYFSACPSENCRGRLQVHLGCIQLSPSCPFRLLHTFLHLRPARHYSRFWIRRPSSERRRDF